MNTPRTVVRAWLLAALVAVSAGCAGLNLTGSQAVSWYTLEDLRGAETVEQSPVTRPLTLLVGPVDANPFYDSTQLAYSRSSQARAYYQFAGWTDRPTKRLARLIERRLVDRAGFEAVAGSTAGIRGDLVLNLTLDELYHDAQASPQQGRIAMHAELIDLRTRTLVARRDFEAARTVRDSDSAGAVAALNEALTAMLGDLALWVELAANGSADNKSASPRSVLVSGNISRPVQHRSF